MGESTDPAFALVPLGGLPADLPRVSAAGAPGMAPVMQQIQELGRMLAQARIDIASIQAEEINGRHLPAAHQELDAIAVQTSNAANQILDACEAMDPYTAELDPDSAAQVQAATMRIFEACGFQDLVGQRITKVMRTLRTIDTKLESIISTFGDLSPPDADFVQPGLAKEHDAMHGARHLMNGPQLPHAAMGQAEIDRLMGGG